jgi:hypothetical protein
MRINFFFVPLALACSIYAHAGEIQFSSATYTAAENVTPLVVTVTRTGDTTAAASVAIASADIGSTAGSDYTSVSTTLSWDAGDATSKTLNLALLDDALVEGSETLSLTLSSPTGDTLGVNSVATVTISDFEEGKLAFSAATFAASESSGTAAITVLRTQGTGGEVQVNYTTANGTATAPEYYTTTSGTLTFADGIANQTINVPLIDNALGELDKALTLTLSLPAGGATLGTLTNTTLTISNDDADFTAGLTLISPVVTNVTQPSSVNLAQNSPLNISNTLLATVNRVPVLSVTELTAAQASDGVVTIVVGNITAHFYPYRVIQLDSIEESEIYLNLNLSGRVVTDEGFQIEFEPALASIATFKTFLDDLGTPKLKITQYGNITVQLNQGPPPLEVDDDGKVFVKNSYYDRYNLRPSITSTLLDANAGISAGVYLLEHPSVVGGAYVEVVYTSGVAVRHQPMHTAPAIADEYIAGLQSLSNVSNVKLSDNGTSTFVFAGRTHRMYADFIVRRVDPTSYSGSITTGLFGVGDLNGDGTGDFRMVYSNGDEQYFFYFPPL